MKQRTRISAWLLTIALLLALLPGAVVAAEPVTVSVTLSQQGAIALGEKEGVSTPIASVPVTVWEENPTVDDVLRSLHDTYYPGGAAMGYATEANPYGEGLSMTKLWGETEGVGGFYCNGVMPWTTVDQTAVAPGDQITIVIYQADWSDLYAFFTPQKAKIGIGEEVALSLFVEQWDNGANQMVQAPLAGAQLVTIASDGTETAIEGKVTDDSGKVTLSFDQPGTYRVSARKEDVSLVAPLCVVEVTGEEAPALLTFRDRDLSPRFSQEVTSYTLPDESHETTTLFVKAGPLEEGESLKASYETAESGLSSIDLVPEAETWTALSHLKTGKTKIEFLVMSSDSTQPIRSYTVSVVRKAALSSLAITQNGREILCNETVDPEVLAYTAKAFAGESLTLSPKAYDPEGSQITVNGQMLGEDGTLSYDIKEGDNTFRIQTTGQDGEGGREYTLTVTGISKASLSYSIKEPANGIFTLWDAAGNQVEETETGRFTSLRSGETYTYTASCYGFLTQHHTLVAGETTELELTLVPAPENQRTGTSDWPSFRGNEENLAVTHAQTPQGAGAGGTQWSTRQKWAALAGTKDSYGFYYPVTAVLANGNVIAASGDTLSLIHGETGEIKASVTMAGTREYAYLPPVYAEGMVFVSLKGGMIQAFDAQTLESLWVSEPVGGQALSAITYSNGYLYTGFYEGESSDGTFVCVSVTDEDPTQPDETKYVTWKSVTKGGYYWTGAYCRDGYVVYVSDNGSGVQTEEGTLFVRDQYTGALIDSAPIVGDGRSAVVCDEKSGTLYVTTKAGYLYAFSLTKEGTIQNLISYAYEGETTSTPVVAGGKVYFGMGGSQDANRIVVADGVTLDPVSEVKMPGYPQGALLLSDAYEEEDGSLYLYATCNTSTGSLMVLKDPGQGEEIQVNVLFTPEESQQNYCISSPICDLDGTLYYANDSGYLFAIGKQEVEYAPLVFSVSPEGATVALKDSKGNEVTPVAPGQYDLPADTYTYTVSKDQYKTQTGTCTITEEEAVQHTWKTETITLSPKGGSDPVPVSVTVSFTLLGDTVHGESAAHSYRENGDSLPRWIETKQITLSQGQTAYDALVLALKQAKLPYVSLQAGYINSINGLSEQDNGPRSGWMYQVNGVIPQKGSSAYTLQDGDVLVWFYTDDYEKEEPETVQPDPGPTTGIDPSPTPSPTPSQEPSPSPSPVPDAGFEDVPQDHWAKGYIDHLAAEGIVKGMSDTVFAPEDKVTRAEFVTLLYRLGGEAVQEAESVMPFDDVLEHAFYTDAVIWAVENGITKGTSSHTFSPMDQIAREDMALMAARFLEAMQIKLEETEETPSFSDVGEIRPDANEAVFALAKAGIMVGKGNGTFDPKGVATRAEAAKVVDLLFCAKEDGAK